MTEAGATAGTIAGVMAGDAEAGAAAGMSAGVEAGEIAGTEAGASMSGAMMPAGAEAGAEMSMGCGDETFFGRCDGEQLIFCDENEQTVEIVDCGENNSERISQSCALINDEYGYDCQSATGSACYLEERPNFCAGADSACVLSGVEGESGLISSCVESVGTCDPEAFGMGSAPQCSGDYLFIGCTLGQPWALDCTSLDGTCGEGTCVIPEGQSCDEMILTCADGLTCADLTEDSLGVCAP